MKTSAPGLPRRCRQAGTFRMFVIAACWIAVHRMAVCRIVVMVDISHLEIGCKIGTRIAVVLVVPTMEPFHKIGMIEMSPGMFHVVAVVAVLWIVVTIELLLVGALIQTPHFSVMVEVLLIVWSIQIVHVVGSVQVLWVVVWTQMLHIVVMVEVGPFCLRGGP